jgi:hypothetical protein
VHSLVISVMLMVSGVVNASTAIMIRVAVKKYSKSAKAGNIIVYIKTFSGQIISQTQRQPYSLIIANDEIL